MAFNIDGKASLKLNRIAVGAAVVLCDYATKKAFAENAIFKGWRDGNGNEVSAPAVMKAMAQDWTMAFDLVTVSEKDGETVTETAPLVLTKDPAGFGCMFRTVGDKLRRVTAYASPEVIAASKPAPVVQEETTEGKPEGDNAETLAAPVVQASKPKRSRKGKAKAENVTPESDISEVTADETASA